MKYLLMLLLLLPCAALAEDAPYTTDTPIADVVNDPVFGDYGRLIFPVDEWYYSGETLGQLRLTWYSNIQPDKTVEIVNYMHDHAAAGDVIFFDIYTEAEKAADPAKRDTGLFFFRGKPGAKFAICNAGGGFAYVGAMHDSFPHALELSKMGYNAFALIYRPGAQTACEDLARAISFIFSHAEELGVDVEGYSLWGGSAGARMAAYLGTYGPAGFGGDPTSTPCGCHHAVHRSQRVQPKRSGHLCLRRHQRRYCQLAHHAAQTGRDGSPGHSHGVPCL